MWLESYYAKVLTHYLTGKGEMLSKKLPHTTLLKLSLGEWHEVRKGEWSPRHAGRILKWMGTDLFPAIGKRPISEIKPAELLAVIKKIERRDALDVAKRQHARCSTIFQYAIQTSRATYNPAADLVGVVKSVKVVPRLAMTQKELGPFLRELDNFDRIKPVTKLGLKLLVHTFVRPGEMRGALWEEFDLDAKEVYLQSA